MTIHLSAVKILRNEADRGRLYIRGRGKVPGEGDSDIFAYFNTKEDERNFERQFSGQSVVIEARAWEFGIIPFAIDA